MAALLAEARPLALEEDLLVLSYPASASFSKRKIEDRANGERLSEALRLVSGRPLAARFEIHDDDDEAEDHPGVPQVRLTEDELIARFKSEFDAEDVADEPAEEPAAAADEN